VTLVDKSKQPQHGWTSVDNCCCPHYNLGTTGTDATFIPPEDHRDTEKAILDSQAAVLKWTMDFPRDETDRGWLGPRVRVSTQHPLAGKTASTHKTWLYQHNGSTENIA